MSEERSRIEQVLAVVRHPSFCPELAPGLVDRLSWPELLELWDLSSLTLRSDPRPWVHLAQAALRDAVLEEMEGRHPALFSAWMTAQSQR